MIDMEMGIRKGVGSVVENMMALTKPLRSRKGRGGGLVSCVL